MRAVSNFAYVKATELRNMLFYGILLNLEPFLSNQQLSHLALFICVIRLLRSQHLVHYSYMYNNHGALSNTGCFGQEDLVGSMSSSHHGSRYYGALITHYYNIDFHIHNKKQQEQTTTNGPDDPSGQSPIEHTHLYSFLCNCTDIHKCFIIYRRFSINH
ncbi:unnamed protein product [Didymodactylos carnosus]|uniref:Uncharacterized protein n=2 Tax=Didymodactylos carnosus TaxID=1234261 RepID=A0A814Q3A4_9BILA|nr:unnamed protein product [Didymodactylos carnosus]CAF3878686.1 unnamed protein product [Didymodactylos carnosus]